MEPKCLPVVIVNTIFFICLFSLPNISVSRQLNNDPSAGNSKGREHLSKFSKNENDFFVVVVQHLKCSMVFVTLAVHFYREYCMYDSSNSMHAIHSTKPFRNSERNVLFFSVDKNEWGVFLWIWVCHLKQQFDWMIFHIFDLVDKCQ